MPESIKCNEPGQCSGPIDIFGECMDRRNFVRVGVNGMFGLIAAQALSQQLAGAENGGGILGSQADSCVLLWMNGGPSHIDTFDPKPGRATGGPVKSIATSVKGIEISEYFPQVAGLVHHLAILRGIESREGNHQRAQYLMHTGYIPNPTVSYPSIGSWVNKEIGDPNFDLPQFVSIRGPSVGAGFLGVAHAPFVVQNPGQPPNNIAYARGIDQLRFSERIKILDFMERGFANRTSDAKIIGHDTTYTKAIRMMHTPLRKAFDISEEPNSVMSSYGIPSKDGDRNGRQRGAGRGSFGSGVLMARRLIETGVKFVEVVQSGWDTHQNNFERTRQLCDGVDPAFAQLIKDLRDRGRLEKTLIVWMGEFGRTPRINDNEGRDHYPRAWSVVLAGGGIKGGQVIGGTDDEGAQSVGKPITVPDLFASLCAALGMNPRKQYHTSQGRPIKITDNGKPIEKLFHG